MAQKYGDTNTRTSPFGNRQQLRLSQTSTTIAGSPGRPREGGLRRRDALGAHFPRRHGAPSRPCAVIDLTTALLTPRAPVR